MNRMSLDVVATVKPRASVDLPRRKSIVPRKSVLNQKQKTELEYGGDVFQELYKNGMIAREDFEVISKINQ